MIQRLLQYDIDCGFCLWQPGAIVLTCWSLLGMALRFSPGCCCQSACGHCDTTPRLQVTLPTVADADCDGCNENIAGTYILDHHCASPNWCRWAVNTEGSEPCSMTSQGDNPCSADDTDDEFDAQTPYVQVVLSDGGTLFIEYAHTATTGGVSRLRWSTGIAQHSCDDFSSSQSLNSFTGAFFCNHNGTQASVVAA